MTLSLRPQPQPILQSALAWLKAPAGDPLHDLAALRQYLKEAAEAVIPPAQRLKLLELLQARTDSTSTLLRPRLLDATLPLPHRLRTIAQGLLDVRGLLASAQLSSLHQLGTDPAAVAEQEGAAHCIRVLANLAEQQQIALIVSTTVPNGLWLQAQEAFRLLEKAGGVSDDGAGRDSLKIMLALVAAQPEAFTAREVAFLIEYLRQYGSMVELSPQPSPPLERWYWLEQSRDLPPVAIARRQPPSQGTLLYFSCAALGKIASQHLIQLANGRSPEELQLPANSIDEYREVLVRAQQRWSSVPRRHSHRRPSHYRVEICARIQTLWRLLHDGAPTKVSRDATPITDWMVLNESPSGFALMHVAGTIDDLAPGDALGLRTASGRPWNIGLIRWARSDNPEHFELGLEMISPTAIPVEIVQPRAAESRRCTALLFPAASGLDRSETLMTRRGQLDTGAFTLIRETDHRLQITQCQTHHLVLQTSKIEIFEFRRDFSSE